MYYRQLDFLRFYAVFQVIILHMHFQGVDNIVYRLLFGVEGVNLFFCISGFLITSILLNTKESQTVPVWDKLRIFYARRFLRIFPLYYLVIFSLLLISVPYRPFFKYDFFYVSNIYYAFLGDFPASPAPHFWSLAMEEQFYLVWPILLYLIPAKKELPVMVVVFFASVLMSYLLISRGFAFAGDRTFGSTAFLSIGGILASVRHTFKERIKWIFPFFYLCLSTYVLQQLLFFYKGIAPSLFLHFLFKLAFAISIVGVFVEGWSSSIIQYIVENRVVLYLGKISYGLYVYHLLMIIPWTFIKRSLGGLAFSHNTEAVMKILLSVLFAAASWHLFENPIQKLKRYFIYN